MLFTSVMLNPAACSAANPVAGEPGAQPTSIPPPAPVKSTTTLTPASASGHAAADIAGAGASSKATTITVRVSERGRAGRRRVIVNRGLPGR